MNGILWSATIDLNNDSSFAHYGMPLISSNNTIFAPVKIAGNAFQVTAFDGSTGNSLYTLSSDYILPAHNWIPVYQPVLTTGPLGSRLYYAGAGGTVYYVDNPDGIHGAAIREVFYTDLATYTAGASGYNSTVFIDTPITADSNGNIFFGFRVQGTAPAPQTSGTGQDALSQAIAALTPQTFRLDLLRRAHAASGDDATDDAALVERLGQPVHVYAGSRRNIKITTPEDLVVAEALLRADR